MAGQQHPFPPGFPTAQQQAMRTQFGGGQMVSGLMNPQQTGMVNPQQFGVGVGGVGTNPIGMSSAQQVMAQQQLAQQTVMQQQIQQMQQQQQQQQQMQLQQQQQATQLAQSSQSTNQVQTPQTPVPPTQPSTQQQQQQQQPQQPQQQQQQNKEVNTVSLCKFGQETVQEIVNRTIELFQTLKVLQPPNGTTQGANVANEKKTKVQDQLRMVKILFRRLRLIYEKCNENCQLQGMEYTHIESLIPLKEEWDMKSDEKKTSEAYRLACEESKEIIEQVISKNRHLKEIIDHLRRIISEINTMLHMRRS